MASSNPKRVEKDDITLRLQVGTTNTILATWLWNRSHTYGYNVEWQYLTKDGIWFKGRTELVGTPNGTAKYDTYEFPELATKVRFRVRPKSKSRPTNENPNQSAIVSENPNAWAILSPGKKTSTSSASVTKTSGGSVDYWTAELSGWKVYKIKPDLTPSVPSPPDITIEGTTLTLSVQTYDENTTHIKFEVYMDDSTFVTTSAYIKPVTNIVSFATTIALGHRYKARAMAYNSKDKSTSDWSNWSSNAKTAPDGIVQGALSATAVSSTSVKLQWDKVDQNATGYIIEYTTNPEFFDQSSSVQTTTVGATNPYAIIEGLDTGKTWFFRVRSTNAQGESGWSEVVSCVLGTDPIAPTIWSSTSTAVYGETVTLYWVHNSEDNSREVRANLVIKTPYDDRNIIVTKQDDSEVSSYVFQVDSLSLEGTVTWSVRTMGLTGNYGPFSETATFKILVQPTLGLAIYKDKEWLWDPFNFLTDTIYTAQGVYINPYTGSNIQIKHYPIYVVATMRPMSQTPIEFNFSIYAESTYQTMDWVGRDVWINQGDLVYSKTIPYTETQTALGLSKNQMNFVVTPGDVILENGITYRIVCTAVSNNGLSAEGFILITMDLEEDKLFPDAEIGIDINTITAYIRPVCYDENGETLYDVNLSVYRRQFDGGFQKIGSDVSAVSETMMVDPHPNLNYARYRIVAYANDTGTFGYYDLPPYPVDVPEIILQWDEKWETFEPTTNDELADPVWTGSMLRLPYNVDTSESNTIDSELVEYIGREHPVSYYGTQVGQVMTLSADISREDDEAIYAIRRLARYLGDVYVREPNGAGYWAQIAVSFSVTHKEVVIPVTISVSRVEGGE